MNDYLKKIASPSVLNYAWHQLPKNHSTSWCGLISVEDMQHNLIRHIGELSEELLAGSYSPELMCYQELNTANSSQRFLCTSTVRDQMVQHAILTVLEPLGEAMLHNGFGLQQASEIVPSKIRQWVHQGYVWLGFANIKDCLDNLPYEPVLKSLYKLCGDQALVTVVRHILESQPEECRPSSSKGRGLPQNMALTPFLRELYLYPLDAFLQNKQIPFMRVADEFVVFAQEEAAASKALGQAEKQVKKLGLALNPEKKQIIRSSPKYKFLGKRLPKAGQWVSNASPKNGVVCEQLNSLWQHFSNWSQCH
jgi:retron-type reverse transcriptase